MYESLVELLAGSNQYFTAGAGLFGLGVASRVSSTVLRSLALVARRNFVVSVEVSSHVIFLSLLRELTNIFSLKKQDPCYAWLLQLVQEKSQIKQVSLSTNFGDDSSSIDADPKFNYHPEPGIHYFVHNRRFYRVILF